MPKRGELDLHWEAMVYVTGYRPETRSERGRWNHALMEIRETGAEPTEIVLRGRAYRRKYVGAELTPTALAAHWGELGAQHSPPSAWQPLPSRSTGSLALPSPEETSDPEATEKAKQAFMEQLRSLDLGRIPE